MDIAPLVSAISLTARWVDEQVSNITQRAAFSTTGLRVSSCLAIERAVEDFLQYLDDELVEVRADQQHCSDRFVRTAFDACKDLPEMKLRAGVDYHGPEDEYAILYSWIHGATVDTIRTQHWISGGADEFSRYMADRLIYKLPWGFNGFLRILAYEMGTPYEDLPLPWQHLPAMTKFGTDNVLACWASCLGVSSHRVAMQLAQRYRDDIIEDAEENASFIEFAKFVVNLPDEYIRYDLEATSFEKHRLAGVRNSIVVGRDTLEAVQSGLVQMRAPVRGIPYEDRARFASQVSMGDAVSLELELDNPYDPYAVKVLFENNQIGYIQKDSARIISREMQLGRTVHAVARDIRPPTAKRPYPWIELDIRLQ
jgi:helicase